MGLLAVKRTAGAQRAPRSAGDARDRASGGARPRTQPRRMSDAPRPAQANTAGLAARERSSEDRMAPPSLAGVVKWEAGKLVHYCRCGEWGSYGYKVNLRAGRLGTWYCREHRPEAGL